MTAVAGSHRLNENKNLRIGIWLGNDVLDSNGASSYYYAIVHAFSIGEIENASISYVSRSGQSPNNTTPGIKVNLRYSLFLHSFFAFISYIILVSSFFKFLNPFKYFLEGKYKKSLRILSDKIDIMYYPVPTDEVIPDFPFIFTVWDLGHFNTYPFPELSMYYSFETRVNFYKTNINKALVIFVESEFGKQQLIQYLNIFPEKIYVLPMLASNVVKDEVKAQKPSVISEKMRFIHYPAHFWAHKNHVNLLIAFAHVLEIHPDLVLVLSGADKGVKPLTMNYIAELGIDKNIIVINRFSLEELKWIYQHSSGLVYPSFLGPSNMPLVEAMELNCPVACSDLAGHREQLGDYALYFDPKSPEKLKNVLLSMLQGQKVNDLDYRKATSTLYRFIDSFNQAIKEIKAVRMNW